MKREFYTKTLVLLALVVGGILIANLAILGLAQWKGLSISSEEDFFALLSDPDNVPMVKGIIGLNHLMTFFISSVFYVMIFYRSTASHWLSLRHFDPVYLLLFPIALFSLYPAMGYAAQLVDKMPLPDYLKGLDESAFSSLSKLLRMESPADLVTNLILVGILPGIGEELLFRGIIQKEIHTMWQKTHMAIWVTAILFSLFHFQVAGFLPKLGIGVILGYAYYYSGSLILPMILHALNNSMATTSLYLAGGDMSVAEGLPAEEIPLMSVLFSTVIFAGVFYYIRSVYKNKILLQS